MSEEEVRRVRSKTIPTMRNLALSDLKTQRRFQIKFSLSKHQFPVFLSCEVSLRGRSLKRSFHPCLFRQNNAQGMSHARLQTGYMEKSGYQSLESLKFASLMIHVRQLRKSYRELQEPFIALDSISFDAMAGQIMGLLGPNGAGKTTCLRILSTVLKPTGGQAIVNGFDVVKDDEKVRHQIGFVSVNTAIYDRMTAWEMVEYFGRLYGMSVEQLQIRMEAVFERFQMNEIRNTLGSKMSTGMKQKVSIARAIIHDPPVLIFDEATSGLDILVAREVLNVVEQLRDNGKCIVYSSHIMSEVSRLCDRIAVMNRGQILAQGTIQELSEQNGEDDLESCSIN